MSIAAVSVCLDAHVEDPSTWRVLVTLADYADPTGRHAFPSVKTTLVDRTGYARSTVNRALAQLLEAGLIRHGDQQLVEHLPSNRRPTVYDLDLVAIRDTRGPIIGPHQGSDRGPTGVRSGAVLGSDPSDTNQELNLRTNARARERPVAAVLADLSTTPESALGRCQTCRQLLTPTGWVNGKPTSVALHRDQSGIACPGDKLPPVELLRRPRGDYQAGAARARATLKETSSQ